MVDGPDVSLSHSSPNAPKESSSNYASGNARVQYGDVNDGDVINNNVFPDQVVASLD